MLLDLDTHEPLTTKMRYIFLQLPLFKKRTEQECETKMEKWLFNLINMEDMDYMAFSNEDDTFKVLESEAAYASLSREKHMDYDRSLKAYRDYKNNISYAREDAREEGREEAMFEVAKKMKESGVDTSTISICTGLSISDIEKL
ncbi:MAG: Rpn family recombination-promoting nuclease/putative transposase [Lachnoclostridium sp.]|nr:Rpn family recombination-promoting nuclease/putative transposase [Lachnoclostridium sp.]